MASEIYAVEHFELDLAYMYLEHQKMGKKTEELPEDLIKKFFFKNEWYKNMDLESFKNPSRLHL